MSKEGVQLVQLGYGAFTGPWWGLVVRNNLNPLPQAQSVSAVIGKRWETESQFIVDLAHCISKRFNVLRVL